MAKRTHKDAVNAANKHMSAEQISQNKNERSKSRSTADKAERESEAVERQSHWGGLSLAEQLKQLDARLGKGVGAVKQRARIKEKIGVDKA